MAAGEAAMSLKLSPSPPSGFDAEPLLLLLSAAKPDHVDAIVVDAFKWRSEGLSAIEADKWQSWLGKSRAEVQQLFVSLSSLVRLVLFSSSSSAVSKQSIAALFPPGFHPSLLALLTRILLSHIAAFRSSAASQLPSPPRLVGFSTAVHSRVSSSVLTHLNQPTIFLSLQLQHPQTRSGQPAEEELITCELKKETLKTMLSGLEKIQEQLSSMQ